MAKSGTYECMHELKCVLDSGLHVFEMEMTPGEGWIVRAEGGTPYLHVFSSVSASV